MIAIEPKEGDRWGRLIFLGKKKIEKRKTLWLMQCDCGTIDWFGASSVCDGHTKSCGCISREKNQRDFDENVPLGHRFQSLTYLGASKVEKNKKGKNTRLCLMRCDCGNVVWTRYMGRGKFYNFTCGCKNTRKKKEMQMARMEEKAKKELERRKEEEKRLIEYNFERCDSETQGAETKSFIACINAKTEDFFSTLVLTFVANKDIETLRFDCLYKFSAGKFKEDYMETVEKKAKKILAQKGYILVEGSVKDMMTRWK